MTKRTILKSLTGLLAAPFARSKPKRAIYNTFVAVEGPHWGVGKTQTY